MNDNTEWSPITIIVAIFFITMCFFGLLVHKEEMAALDRAAMKPCIVAGAED